MSEINLNPDLPDDEFVKMHNAIQQFIEIVVKNKFKDSPLLGLYRQSLCSANGTLNLMLKLKSVAGPDITKSKWQSLQAKLNNYEALKKENEMLKDKLESIGSLLQ